MSSLFRIGLSHVKHTLPHYQPHKHDPRKDLKTGPSIRRQNSAGPTASATEPRTARDLPHRGYWSALRLVWGCDRNHRPAAVDPAQHRHYRAAMSSVAVPARGFSPAAGPCPARRHAKKVPQKMMKNISTANTLTIRPRLLLIPFQSFVSCACPSVTLISESPTSSSTRLSISP
mgnify:CR=1 FL=1